MTDRTVPAEKIEEVIAILAGEIARLRTLAPLPPGSRVVVVVPPEGSEEKVVRDRADWLLDAVATSTQDRRFLRGDEAYDHVAGEAIILNARKAITAALRALTGGDDRG